MSRQRLTSSLLELPWFRDGVTCEFRAQDVGLLLVEDDKLIVVKQRFPLCINRVAAGSFLAEFVRAALVVGPLHIPLIPGDTPAAAVTFGRFRLYALATYRQGTIALIWLPAELGSQFGAFAEALSAYAAIRSIGSTRYDLDPDVINVHYNAILSGGGELFESPEYTGCSERSIEHFPSVPNGPTLPRREPNVLLATSLEQNVSESFEDGLPEQHGIVIGSNHRVDGDERVRRIIIKQRPEVNLSGHLLEQCYSLQIGKPTGSSSSNNSQQTQRPFSAGIAIYPQLYMLCHLMKEFVNFKRQSTLP